MKFTELSKPFIIGVVTDGDVDSCIRTIKLGEYDGADGFQLELQGFKDFPPSKEQMKDIICSTNKPIWTTNRRPKRGVKAHPNRYVSEEKRMQLQLDALDAGAVCIDMELDTFDHWQLWDEARRKIERSILKDIPVNPEDFPQECCFQGEAIEKQKEIIDQVHSVDCEVLMSCHVRVRTTQAGTLKIGREMEARNADLVKIVVWNDDFYDLCNTLRDNVYLKEKMNVPFKLMSQGEPSKLGRALFAMFGSAWAFCLQDLTSGGFHYRPLISTVKYIMQHVDWQPNWERHRKYT
jgi:3-dehydroquinate dehydratase